LGEPLFGNFYIAPGRDPRFFLKRVQHVDSTTKASGVNDAVFAGVFFDSQFLYACANGRHRFEIIRLLPTLHQL
jgi:hypothetical protein